MIAGIGVDVVDVARFERSLARTPRLVERLFVPAERDRAPRSLAARFAAKEALLKVIGGAHGVRWHDMEVVSDDHGNPAFRVTGTVAAAFAELGIGEVHLSMSHDAGLACAFVVAERGIG
ncbi:holo-ACP synthase [Compostimonas suwonensis]|uniref:Holo-[acyl-carrier-protein] synthase n=1 Tax=Compostimonas suwonensis TaxID=1048394 RepID=A0A2M9BV60_9MICO|nr:holo-ACP synthase [Compostimonas suwonensis]PJJ61841.1 holo-[acyl-carrier protein] synthase [Compostimonas suwonensis]